LQTIELPPSQIAHPVSCIAQAAEPAGWFALYTVSRHEKRVAQHLSQREIEHFLPLYRAQRKWRDGSRVTLDLPLFPGYMFVRVRRIDRVRVLEVPGAVAMVAGTGGHLVVLPDATIEALRSGVESCGVEPHTLLVAGRRVHIRSGPFAGMDGVVVRNKTRCRVVLTLEHIHRSFSVELGLEEVEPVSAEELAAV
jgi:transcription antitermination factor NusG